MLRILILTILFSKLIFAKISKIILENNYKIFSIKLKIDVETESDIFPTRLHIGLPSKNLPETQIQFLEKTKLPFILNETKLESYEWINQQKIKNLEVGSINISPLANDKEYFKTIIVTIKYKESEVDFIKANKTQTEFLKNKIINWKISKNWFLKKQNNESRRIVSRNGEWLNFNIPSDGIYSISYSSLDSIINNIQNIDPRSISIFLSENLGRSKEQNFNQAINDNLVEVSIKIDGEEDGTFDPDDKIIFYGRGSSGFDLNNTEYQWNQNLYYSSNFCWLYIPHNIDERGKRINLSNQINICQKKFVQNAKIMMMYKTYLKGLWLG